MSLSLALDRGVILQLNDQAGQRPLKFRACLPGGCLVPLNFDAKIVAALRAGTTFNAKAISDSGQDQPFTISLKGGWPGPRATVATYRSGKRGFRSPFVAWAKISSRRGQLAAALDDGG
jgi:hypothetical protein